MDKIDIAILREMSQSQTMHPAKMDLPSSYREIAKRIGCSAGTVRNRVSKLYASGVLTGSSVYINPTILGLKGAAYACDVSQRIGKDSVVERLKKDGSILFIHNFRGSLVGISFVYRDGHAETVERFLEACGAQSGSLSRIDYPSCRISIGNQEWQIIESLSSGLFQSYSRLAGELKISVRTLLRRLSKLRTNGAILSAPSLNYKAIRGGLATDIIVAFTTRESKLELKERIMQLVGEYAVFVGDGTDYVVYNLILPSVTTANELVTSFRSMDGVKMVRAELVEEHIDLTSNLRSYLKPAARSNRSEDSPPRALSAIVSLQNFSEKQL